MEPATLYTLPQDIYIVYWLPHHYASQSPPAVGGGSIQPAGTRVGSKYLAVGGWLHIYIYIWFIGIRTLFDRGVGYSVGGSLCGGRPEAPLPPCRRRSAKGELTGSTGPPRITAIAWVGEALLRGRFALRGSVSRGDKAAAFEKTMVRSGADCATHASAGR